MSANSQESAAYHAELSRLHTRMEIGLLTREQFLDMCSELQNRMFASLPMIVCAYHEKHFGAPFMQEGDASKVSHGCCSDCEAIELAAVEAYHAARREAV